MIKIENTETTGWEAAIRGMRNSYNSWDKSDSFVIDSGLPFVGCDEFAIGEADYQLMMKLCKAGSDHRKFLRMITVSADVTAPLYFYKQLDTYRMGVEKNSCSTMHTIQNSAFDARDFSTGYFDGDCYEAFDYIIDALNKVRQKYIKTKDKTYWYQLIQLLPSSYNQRRTYMFSYEVLANIYKSRKNHKLDEWHSLCDWIQSLPYSELITGENED